MEDLLKSEVIDITIPLEENCIRYEKLEGFKRTWIRKIGDEKGNKLNMSKFSLNSHVGTHVDAPLHFIKDGKSIDKRPIKDLIGMAQVIKVINNETVTEKFLKNRYKDVPIVLFNFGNDRLNREYDYFDKSGIEFLLNKGVKAVGTDNFSPDSKGTKYDIHYMLLSKEKWIIEVLKLEGVEEGIYNFMCLPLAVKGGEASTARAILFK